MRGEVGSEGREGKEGRVTGKAWWWWGCVEEEVEGGLGGGVQGGQVMKGEGWLEEAAEAEGEGIEVEVKGVGRRGRRKGGGGEGRGRERSSAVWEVPVPTTRLWWWPRREGEGGWGDAATVTPPRFLLVENIPKTKDANYWFTENLQGCLPSIQCFCTGVQEALLV